MYTGFFDVFHHTADEQLGAVVDGVDVDLGGEPNCLGGAILPGDFVKFFEFGRGLEPQGAGVACREQGRGRKRFSGLAFQVTDVSNSLSSARPLRVSFCLRVSHSRSDGTR